MELSDIIVDFRADGSRHPVRVSDAIAKLGDAPFASSRRLAEQLPRTDEIFDAVGVDGVLLRSHLELQRLAEEIQHGERVARLLRPFLDLIEGPKRVVDIGCGLGYLVRHFASTSSLGDNVEVIGFDFNQGLLGAAQRLAEIEDLDCRFVAGDAFELETEATLYISSGVIHHFSVPDLSEFFARQHATGAAGCFHFDVAPTWVTPLGAWVFHRARMREPLARHDGLRSALRAHADDDLLRAVQSGAPEWEAMLFDATGRRMAVLNVMRPVIGMNPELVGPYRHALGKLARRLT